MSEEIVQEETYEEVLDTTEPEAEDVTEGDGEGNSTKKPGEIDYDSLSREEAIDSLKKANRAIIKNKKPNPVKKELTTDTQPEGDEPPEWGKKLLESEAKRQFQSENGLTPDTVDAVFRANGGKMPTAEQMESDDLIKTVVRSYQSKSRVAANTPSGGSQPVYKGKTYADIATDKDATPADKQAAFEATKKKHGIK